MIGRFMAGGVLAAAVLIAGCRPAAEREVVVYSALDQEFSAPILNDFARSTGIAVRPVYDVESTKTVGLVNRLLQEGERTRCDVFWNNEILHTLRLERAGLLDAYLAPAAREIPANYRAASKQWTGFAARARILIVNTKLIGDGPLPSSVEDLADPRWRGKAGLARPLFGTTATHAAVLFSLWGDERAQQFFRDVQRNAVVLSGNKQVALAVARGELAFGLTDTDDAIVEMDAGSPVTIVFPDQGPEQSGTLFIPNTVAILRNAPHPREARALVDYLLAPEIEQRLQAGPSAQFPVHPAVEKKSRVPGSESVRWMDVDFEAAADKWDAAGEFLYELFEREPS